MKRKLLLISVLFLTAINLWASDFIVNGIAYNITSSTTPYKVEVTLGGTYSGGVTIPSSVSNNGILYSVTSIGYHAFVNCSSLTSIIIPNSITLIDIGAFANCTGLTSITIPSSVTDFGPWVFLGCSSLTSFHVQNTTPIILSALPINDIFDSNSFSTCTLYVPVGSKSAYQKSAVWGNFINMSEDYLNNIQMISANDLLINIQTGKVFLTNLSVGEKVQVFTTDGKLIFTENATKGSLSIQLPSKTYIIKIGMRSAKIIM